MKAITFSPVQQHIFTLVSHINTPKGLVQLRDQLAKFYVSEVDKDMEELWALGQWDEKTLTQLQGSHLRTPYRK